MVARREEQVKEVFLWSFVLFTCWVFFVVVFFHLLNRERCEYKRKEPRNGEKQKGLQAKALD